VKRILRLDICDYSNTVLCNLYDNHNKVSGCAHDVFVITERNGNKELTFSVPSVYNTGEGIEKNYRLSFLKAEYRLRTIDDDEVDYFIISEPRIVHNHFSEDVDVRAPHISSNLKNKAIDLEFSDEEGNNVGTADALLDTILEGTGWTRGYVEVFTEEDGSIKKRSMSSSAGAGALSLIQQLCELFEASPVYHGGNRTIDIVSMNPFSKTDAGTVPQEVMDGRNVIELHYDRNIKNFEKTVNTENMITRLYCYGAYGSEVTGYCSIQTCEHDEYEFTAPASPAGSWLEFQDDTGAYYYFSPTETLIAGQKLIWSKLDFASRSYVWNDNTQKAYKVVKEPDGSFSHISGTKKSVVNKFPYLMDFNYYNEVGLLTDDMFQEVAKFQRSMSVYYDISEKAASDLAAYEWELSQVGESNTGFAKLNVLRYGTDNGYTKIYLNNTPETPDGIIYRSDYDSAEKDYFQWHVAKKFKTNGDPFDGIGSVIYVVHQDGTWDKAYVTGIYDSNNTLYVGLDGEPTYYSYNIQDDYPSAIRINAEGWGYTNTDRVYLFCTNSMSGMLGAKQVEDEAVLENLETQTTEVTEKHPVYFGSTTELQPDTTAIHSSYGWYYKYSETLYEPGTLYFCWGARGDRTWQIAYVANEAPNNASNGQYFYNTKYRTLHHRESGKWVKYESVVEQRLAAMFTKVFYYCRRRDMLYKGLYEHYVSSANLNAGNYAIPNEFAFYWTFTTDRATNTLKLESTTGYVYQNGDNVANIVTASVYPFDAVTYPAENELRGFTNGSVDPFNGVEIDSSSMVRSSNLIVYESTPYEYSLPNNSLCVFYDINSRFISSQAVGGAGVVQTPAKTRHVRIVCQNEPLSSHYFRVQGYASKIYLNDKMYQVLNSFIPDTESDLNGINELTRKFAELSDKVYGECLPALKEAQARIKEEDALLTDTLGEILKENKWQDSSFVQGDEQRLYTKSMENLEELAKPEITYTFDFLDLYGSNHDIHYYENNDVEWPDIKITDAAHLVDPELKESVWAYIDRINKCYDQEWRTTLDINTKLSLVGQHEFTDVLTRIAEVAKDIKGKQNIYDRAAMLNSGSIPSDKLEGTIQLNQTVLKGGASNYYTDPNGNIIFESADGLSAMILGGRGLGISNQKTEDGDWLYRSALTGTGLTADVITTGYMSADRIEAGSITTDKLSSNVGQELEISSNKALLLYATVNGSRPAGTVKTTDAIIEIKAGNETDKAQVNVISGGELNMTGGDINISSQGKLDLQSSGEFHLRSNGADNINSTADGLYMGSDGVNFGGGKFKVVFSGNSSAVIAKSQSIFFGDLTYINNGQTYNYPIESVLSGAALKVDSINGNVDLLANNTINIGAGKTLTLLSGGNVLIGNSGSPFTIGSNGTVAYIYNGKTTLSDTTHNGAYYGTDGLIVGKVGGNYVKATADGTVDITGTIHTGDGDIAGWAISSATLKGNKTGLAKTNSDTAIAIWAGTTDPDATNTPFYVRQDGYVKMSNLNVSGGTINVNNNFIVASDGSATINKGSITIGSNFSVSPTGVLKATSGEFSGKITAEEGTIGDWNIRTGKLDSSSGTTYVALDSSTTLYPKSGTTTPVDTMYAFWCGANAPNSAPFSVTKDGVVTISQLRVNIGTAVSPNYQVVDMNKWFSSDDPEDFDVTVAMGKLKFQTVKSIKVDSVTGKVTINLTTSGGGTRGVSFDSAVSLSGAWDGTTYSISAITGTIKGTIPTTSIYQDIVGTPNPSKTIYANIYHDSPSSENLINTTEMTLKENVSSKTVTLSSNTFVKGSISTAATYNAGHTEGYNDGYGDASGRVSLKTNAYSIDYDETYRLTVPVRGYDGSTLVNSTRTIVFSGPPAVADVTVSSIARSGDTITATLSNGNTGTLTLESHTNCASGLTRYNNGNQIALYYTDSSGRYVSAGNRYWYYRSSAQSLHTYYT